jgi:hypothetical protein
MATALHVSVPTLLGYSVLPAPLDEAFAAVGVKSTIHADAWPAAVFALGCQCMSPT